MARTDSWYLERVLWLIAGVFTLASVALAVTASPWWLILTALVGLNLIMFAVTGFCLMASVLQRFGAEPALNKKENKHSDKGGNNAETCLPVP